jgi:hypothetical protein
VEVVHEPAVREPLREEPVRELEDGLAVHLKKKVFRYAAVFSVTRLSVCFFFF